MENFLSLFKVMFLLVLCFMGNAEANVYQAKSKILTGHCHTLSKTFSGQCVEPAHDCTDACISEGYQFGTCGDSKECYCVKPCPLIK
ncbi:hypothetical protein P3L10_034518 [Capsicum annuum]